MNKKDFTKKKQLKALKKQRREKTKTKDNTTCYLIVYPKGE